MRVLVCGGRDFEDFDFISAYLGNRLIDYYGWHPDPEPYGSWYWDNLHIIEGGAQGADAGARIWARANYVDLIEFPADWKRHGKRAGYLRNVQMLEEGKPDLVIAFPGGKGTAMMVKLARDAGVPVEEVKYEI